MDNLLPVSWYFRMNQRGINKETENQQQGCFYFHITPTAYILDDDANRKLCNNFNKLTACVPDYYKEPFLI